MGTKLATCLSHIGEFFAPNVQKRDSPGTFLLILNGVSLEELSAHSAGSLRYYGFRWKKTRIRRIRYFICRTTRHD